MHDPFSRTTPRRPRRVLAAGAASLLLMVSGLAACGDDTSASGSSGAAASGASSAPVSVIDKVMFVDREVRVAAGTAVEFDNRDNQPHTATSDANHFDTGLIAAGSKASITFDKAGTYAYHCSLHPFMTAQIVVS